MPAYHGIQNNSQAPHIHWRPVVLFAADDFGGCIAGAAAVHLDAIMSLLSVEQTSRKGLLRQACRSGSRSSTPPKGSTTTSSGSGGPTHTVLPHSDAETAAAVSRIAAQLRTAC